MRKIYRAAIATSTVLGIGLVHESLSSEDQAGLELEVTSPGQTFEKMTPIDGHGHHPVDVLTVGQQVTATCFTQSRKGNISIKLDDGNYAHTHPFEDGIEIVDKLSICEHGWF